MKLRKLAAAMLAAAVLTTGLAGCGGTKQAGSGSARQWR
jgi:ABC-type glycerol-3-phosphate transport system substrate-binding protein